MKKVIAVVALAFAVVPLSAAARPQRGGGRGGGVAVERAPLRGDVHVVFSSTEVQVLREYYVPRHRNLPPGLRKKLARTGQLPPGWQKRMQPLPVVVERQLVVLPPDYRRGVIDGNAVIYAPRRGVIIDATVVF